MSDTYTPNYNLILPAIGGDPNTWGNLLNENFTTIDTAMEANATAAAAASTAAAAANSRIDVVTPIGAIMFWDLTRGAIPTGWQQCDGTNGTPNTLGLFPVAATAGGAGAYPNRGTGGFALQTLSIANLPAHGHPTVDNGHSHALNDPGHVHTIYDPGHDHSTIPTGPLGGTQGFPLQGSPTTGQFTGTSGTGIAVQTGKTNATINPNVTGISVGNTGSGASFDNRPPYIALIMIQRIS